MFLLLVSRKRMMMMGRRKKRMRACGYPIAISGPSVKEDHSEEITTSDRCKRLTFTMPSSSPVAMTFGMPRATRLMAELHTRVKLGPSIATNRNK